jgi:hypothetical protein
VAHALRPGYEDARLLVQLAEWHSAAGLPGALRWIWSDEFIADYSGFVERHPPGSEGDRLAALVCDYFETVGALHKHGLLNEDLLFDWLPVSHIWDRVKEYALGQRRAAGGAIIWGNFEALASAHKRLTGEYST